MSLRHSIDTIKAGKFPRLDLFVLILLAALVIAPAHAPAQPAGEPETYVGKAGGVFVSEREFVERFEMLPGLYRHRIPQLNGAKLELLYSIIAEKLLAQEATARNLDRDSVVQTSLAGVESDLARDELYRREVRNKVTVSEAEIRKGTSQALVQILLAYIFCDTQQEADFLRGQIKTTKDFDATVIDSSMGALRDTATVVWGEAEPIIEEAAYRLKRGEVSPVVHASEGFYILKRVRVDPSSTWGSLSPDVLHQRIEEKIRARKEQQRAMEFAEAVLKDKVGRSLPGPFKVLARAMEDLFARHSQDSLLWLTPALGWELRAHLGRSLNDTLVFVGSAQWTIDEVIEKLLYRRFSVAAADIHTMPSRLNAEIRLMVQQQLLGEEAVRRGLENDPAVTRQLAMWHDSYLADIMKEYVRRRVTVSDAEVYSYLRSKDPGSTVPLVRIRELRTSTLSEMSEALSDLEHGLPFERVIEKWSNDSIAKATKGVSEFFPMTERAPIGEIAYQMEIGQRYGPVRVPHGLLYFELLAKKNAEMSDTTSSARFAAAKTEFLEMKQRRTITLLLAQLAHEHGVTVFEDRITKVPVTPIPMMTFRLLGFGGRMLAVPFVQKELDWLDVDPPKQKILP